MAVCAVAPDSRLVCEGAIMCPEACSAVKCYGAPITHRKMGRRDNDGREGLSMRIPLRSNMVFMRFPPFDQT